LTAVILAIPGGLQLQGPSEALTKTALKPNDAASSQKDRSRDRWTSTNYVSEVYATSVNWNALTLTGMP